MTRGTPRVNGERLNSTLQSTCSQYGALENTTGMRRLALSQEDKDVRDWLVTECKNLGCEVLIDEMGNIFAIREGTSKCKKPIAMGSHMDTQPAGGRYDGILGVHAALEVLRTLRENNIDTHCPVALVNWTNEEGARFPGAMMSSGVWSTKSTSTLQDCHSTYDPSSNTSLRDALEHTGYLGRTPCDHRQNGLSAHFELHIEQGPKLELTRRRVGVVTAVQAMRWFAVRVTGREAHSGTTPMNNRSDALVTAAHLIAGARDTALETGLGVATVGVIHSDTQSQAIIPSGVDLILDVRSPTDSLLTDLCAALFAAFDTVVATEHNHTAYRVVRTWGLPESTFHPTCIEVVRAAALEALVQTGLAASADDEAAAATAAAQDLIMDMKSAAGHDSAWTSRVVPTSMIFVPSRDGISHHPDEYTSPEDCTLGAQVLLGAVLRYDALVAI